MVAVQCTIDTLFIVLQNRLIISQKMAVHPFVASYLGLELCHAGFQFLPNSSLSYPLFDYTTEYGCIEALAYVVQCVCAIYPHPPMIPSIMYLIELMYNDAIQYQGRDVYNSLSKSEPRFWDLTKHVSCRTYGISSFRALPR